MHRNQLVEELRRLHSEQKNVLLVGPAGIGKTTLLRTLGETLPLIICDETSSLGRICDCLESRVGWSHEKLDLIGRKNRLLRHLHTQTDPIALDHVAETPPRVARFVGHLLGELPVWIACRSDRRREIGHVWENLYRFVRVEVPPLTEIEATRLIEVAVNSGAIQPDAVRHCADLYRISQGSPRTLAELIAELAARKYNMHSATGLRLLELDRRIHKLDRCDRPVSSGGS
jgi:energy-coupling factor transporter ATP-binding protein EcfA2